MEQVLSDKKLFFRGTRLVEQGDVRERPWPVSTRFGPQQKGYRDGLDPRGFLRWFRGVPPQTVFSESCDISQQPEWSTWFDEDCLGFNLDDLSGQLASNTA
jgi:hypothetical protein